MNDTDKMNDTDNEHIIGTEFKSVESFMEAIRGKKHSPPIEVFLSIYYFFLRLWEDNLCPRMIFRHTKWTFQKIFKGYSTPELWELDHTIGKFVHKRIKAFREMETTGIPSTVIPPDYVDTPENFEQLRKNWDDILKQIEDAFAIIENSYEVENWDGTNIEDYRKKQDENLETVRKGLKLLAEHYMGLWD